ncbi:hypothetical protein SAMN05192543_101341 [Paraburkholderia megapolitana]|uniref:Uncharacterized protein n=1 Tax=Paraburkholderia megapolitana TaxID=420953 RepID=A0A1I3DJ65_9BURK|nr:hypothetical protein SAMN05192543_101341 [Paraburkholderia megapolitana]
MLPLRRRLVVLVRVVQASTTRLKQRTGLVPSLWC